MPLKIPSFAERQKAADKAKQAQMEKIRTAVRPEEAPSGARQAAQLEAATAHRTRTAERKAATRAAAERKEAERVAEKARQAQAVADEKARKDAEHAAKLVADAARKIDQKAERDAKYAARKARQN